VNVLFLRHNHKFNNIDSSLFFVLQLQPEKFAQSILLFCKGQGLLTSITMPGVERQRTFSGSSADGEGRTRRLSRGMSMEEYDKPNIRRLSITTPGGLPQLPRSD